MSRLGCFVCATSLGQEDLLAKSVQRCPGERPLVGLLVIIILECKICANVIFRPGMGVIWFWWLAFGNRCSDNETPRSSNCTNGWVNSGRSPRSRDAQLLEAWQFGVAACNDLLLIVILDHSCWNKNFQLAGILRVEQYYFQEAYYGPATTRRKVYQRTQSPAPTAAVRIWSERVRNSPGTRLATADSEQLFTRVGAARDRLQRRAIMVRG